MRVISVLNLKGGVAKTFTAANVAYELYRRGYRVLLIDNDKQGNLSKAYSRYDAENIAPVTKLLAGDWCNVDELIQHTDYEGIDIVTANMGIELWIWQKTYMTMGTYRQMGATTAQCLRVLLFSETTPLDYSSPPRTAREDCERQQLREIYQKLNEAGIQTRKVFWSSTRRDTAAQAAGRERGRVYSVAHVLHAGLYIRADRERIEYRERYTKTLDYGSGKRAGSYGLWD